VAKAYDFEEDDEYFYVIMKYYEGKDLSDYYPTEFLPKEIILCIARQLIDAVKYCHDNNVLHRDIKVDNVLVKDDKETPPRIVLADFGFSSISPLLSLLDTYSGTPPYAAPELFNGIPHYGAKADIWAIGITLYVLFVNDVPFSSENKAEFVRQVCNDDIFTDPNSDVNQMVPLEWQNLIKWMLNKDPMKRPSLEEIEKHPCFN
jgi:serine/threonine protein kinase